MVKFNLKEIINNFENRRFVLKKNFLGIIVLLLLIFVKLFLYKYIF